jgi:hypothetical protein
MKHSIRRSLHRAIRNQESPDAQTWYYISLAIFILLTLTIIKQQVSQ